MHVEKGLKTTERDFTLLIFAKIKKKLSHILSEMLKKSQINELHKGFVFLLLSGTSKAFGNPFRLVTVKHIVQR